MVQHSKRFRPIFSMLGATLLASACTSLAPHESTLPAGAVPVATPAIYREWHQKTEACSGLKGDFSTVQFYVVPAVETFPTEAGPKVGLWTSEHGVNRIVIAGEYQNHEMVVSHELLHALLAREGHPAEYFVERCHLTWETWNSAAGD